MFPLDDAVISVVISVFSVLKLLDIYVDALRCCVTTLIDLSKSSQLLTCGNLKKLPTSEQEHTHTHQHKQKKVFTKHNNQMSKT